MVALFAKGAFPPKQLRPEREGKTLPGLDEAYERVR